MNSYVNRQAYLIMAHSDVSLLNKLISCLDFECNDIYIHIDKKSKLTSTQIVPPKKSSLYFIPSKSVFWGGDSQIKVTINLLEYALHKGQYSYLHFISGCDLLLQPIQEIYQYFENHFPNNYLSIDHKFTAIEDFHRRIGTKHYLQNQIGREITVKEKICKVADYSLSLIQKIIGFDRTRTIPMELKKGSSWFSITQELAAYVVQQKHVVKRYFYNSFCGDEIFMQTICYNSPFKNTMVDDNLRAIDWTRGQPYTWRKEDYDELLTSGKMFARKFNSQVDEAIIDKIVSHCVSKAEKETGQE